MQRFWPGSGSRCGWLADWLAGGWIVGLMDQAQWPSRQTQPLPCCCHWPGTQAVDPGGTATYWPGCQFQGLPAAPV
jgi:hypothetical protein